MWTENTITFMCLHNASMMTSEWIASLLLSRDSHPNRAFSFPGVTVLSIAAVTEREESSS